MHSIEVSLGDRSYDICIGADQLNSKMWLKYLSQQVLIVTNLTVAPLYGQALLATLKKVDGVQSELMSLPDGEQYKTLETLDLIFSELLSLRFTRKASIVALGGGVVGDISGFAAACYQRGIDFVQIPTTLLAQVDSSVGGKTAVNHPAGKNMIGAFYQPKHVLIDIDVLNTLPQRELIAGVAEIIKYGLIFDHCFFEWLELNILKLIQRDPETLMYAIKRSCEIKAEVVGLDERENGIRAILNLGHTFGHAIEAFMGYGSWLHGEAVGAGMVMACALSHKLNWISEIDYKRALNLIKLAGLPISSPDKMTAEHYLKYMSVDKKVVNNQLRLILLKSIGEAVVTADFDSDGLTHTLDEFTVS